MGPLILFIAGWVALFHGQFIFCLLLWYASHTIEKERSK